MIEDVEPMNQPGESPKEDYPIKERIRVMLTLMHLTINSLSNNTTVQRRLSRQINEKAQITVATLLYLLQRLPEINPLWLLTGEGEMLVAKEDENSGERTSLVAGNTISGNTRSNINFGIQKGRSPRDVEKRDAEHEAAYSELLGRYAALQERYATLSDKYSTLLEAQITATLKAE